jgi:hypothetical protein
MSSQTKLINSDGSSPVSGSFIVEGVLHNVLDKDFLESKKVTTSLNAKLKHFPTESIAPLHFFSPELDDFLEAALGAEVNAGIKLDLNKGKGPLNIQLTSSHTTASLKGSFQEGNLSLDESARASLRLTPSVLESLGKINPVLRDIKAVSKPVTLLIAKESTKVPLFKWDPEQFSVGLSTLEVDKVTFKRDNQFKPLLQILNTRSDLDNLSAWFSPVRFEVQKGIINCLRSDVLLDYKIHALSWGMINLNDDKVDMTIAITGDTLERTIGARNLPHDYTMQVPINGKLGDLSVDWGIAAAQLSGLQVKKHVSSTIGSILGGVADTLGTFRKRAVPPPPPLPWTAKDIRGTNEAKKVQQDPSFQKDIHQSIESLFDIFEKK